MRRWGQGWAAAILSPFSALVICIFIVCMQKLHTTDVAAFSVLSNGTNTYTGHLQRGRMDMQFCSFLQRRFCLAQPLVNNRHNCPRWYNATCITCTCKSQRQNQTQCFYLLANKKKTTTEQIAARNKDIFQPFWNISLTNIKGDIYGSCNHVLMMKYNIKNFNFTGITVVKIIALVNLKFVIGEWPSLYLRCSQCLLCNHCTFWWVISLMLCYIYILKNCEWSLLLYRTVFCI